MSNIDVVLRNRDVNAVFKSPLKQKIKKIAIENGIKYHYKDAYLKNKMARDINLQNKSIGTTELGRLIAATKGTLQGTTLQIPTIEYHTVNETASIKSVESVITILKKLYINGRGV